MVDKSNDTAGWFISWKIAPYNKMDQNWGTPDFGNLHLDFNGIDRTFSDPDGPRKTIN